MVLRRIADRLLRGLTLACMAAWVVLFVTLAADSTRFLLDGLEQSARAWWAIIERQPCLALFLRAGESFLRFVVEFGLYVALGWAGVEAFRRALLRKLAEPCATAPGKVAFTAGADETDEWATSLGNPDRTEDLRS
ncbi:MAG: hypothetical protein WED34_21040 [Planctomycetales bacterium]